MATRNILRDDDPGLLKKSRAVTEYNQRLHILLDDMKETLIKANGLGLAAPQVGVLRRAVLIVDSEVETDSPEDQIIELINPQILECDGEQEGREGCLSVPGVYGIVTRPESVKVAANDRYGNSFELSASQLTARAICHEVDHLDGIVFTSIVERFLTEEEIAELTAEFEQQYQQNDDPESTDEE